MNKLLQGTFPRNGANKQKLNLGSLRRTSYREPSKETTHPKSEELTHTDIPKIPLTLTSFAGMQLCLASRLPFVYIVLVAIFIYLVCVIFLILTHTHISELANSFVNLPNPLIEPVTCWVLWLGVEETAKQWIWTNALAIVLQPAAVLNFVYANAMHVMWRTIARGRRHKTSMLGCLKKGVKSSEYLMSIKH